MRLRKYFCVALAAISLLFSSPGLAGETTMPSQYVDSVNPLLAQKYEYVEDGAYTDALKIPTYQWMPVNAKPRVIFLGIHGLTLHGRRFRVLARTMAVNGAGFITMDMRGFGRSFVDEQKRFSTPDNDRTKVDHHKSYDEIVALLKLIKQQYPDVDLIALGESLGCTFCVRLASEYPDLVSGVVLSAPAVHVNKDMYFGKGQIEQGLKAVISIHHELDMRGFFAELCSQRLNVQNEMMDDPLIRKKLTLGSLIATDEFVAKTALWGKSTSKDLAVLILQGSADGCVSPKHVTDLMNSMPSDDQTLAWRGKFGHLQLETSFMRAATVDALGNWLLEHTHDQVVKVKGLEQCITNVGGTITD
ncbi:MAG: alpha/beta hydrolase [Candidatus Obscuribacterales bacterium]|nr:alpha/beta hydrolase [Candidatus Obscuribacterales bacterium]